MPITRTTTRCISLDGSQGEGGGQILRSALTLAMITGQPFRISRIRARRSRPGLLRQHLTAVQAAASVCSATVQGAELGSTTLGFQPGKLRGGDYRFAIGSAGSATLVLQTLLPALWFADAPSSVTVSGGTHNPAAPPVDFLIRCWQPLVAQLGVTQQISLQRHGFYPAGGGVVSASVTPGAPTRPFTLLDRGELLAIEAEAIVADVPQHVARRELDTLAPFFDGMLIDGVRADGVRGQVVPLAAEYGPGNVLQLTVRHRHVSEQFTAFGQRGLPAEAVARQAAKAALHYLRSPAAVGEHLADQLLLPLALAGSGAFSTSAVSGHLLSNIAVIEQFLPQRFALQPLAEHCTQVTLRG